jgi:hypothetical protein
MRVPSAKMHRGRRDSSSRVPAGALGAASLSASTQRNGTPLRCRKSRMAQPSAQRRCPTIVTSGSPRRAGDPSARHSLVRMDGSPRA